MKSKAYAEYIGKTNLKNQCFFREKVGEIMPNPRKKLLDFFFPEQDTNSSLINEKE